MAYLSDIEIAQSAVMEPITSIAQRAHVDEKYIEQYGRYKAKIDPALLKDAASGRKAGAGNGDYADACRRRKDHDDDRAG